MTTTTNDPAELRRRAEALRLNGLLAHFDQAVHGTWLAPLLDWEETERSRRSMERRVRRAHIGAFKPLVDFDWSWPTKCDRAAIEELMNLEFLAEATNVVLFGPNGIGKTTIARNLAQHALDCGHTVHFANAGELLGDLAALDSASTRNRRLRHYAGFDVLVIDEVGYLSYSNRHADLLFELTNRRYEKKSTIVTTNRAFSEWHEVFPNAACVVSLVDRLTHHAEIIALEGKSYRHKEAQEHAAQRAQRRRRKKP
jgi:DNA replication protein DnaC